MTESSTPSAPRTSSGAGRALVAVYGLFALAATARATVQLATRFEEAPVAYLLSAVAGLIYIVATVTLARGSRTSRRVAWVAIGLELVGVLTVGTLSVLDPAAFPRATVWSVYGIGYGFVPLVLPVLGLLWLARTRPAVSPAGRRSPDGARSTPEMNGQRAMTRRPRARLSSRASRASWLPAPCPSYASATSVWVKVTVSPCTRYAATPASVSPSYSS